MKKIVILLAVMMLGASGIAGAEETANKIVSLANQYKHYEDFEVVKVGPLLMKLAKWTVKDAADDEDLEDLKMMNGIKKIVIVEYEDAEEKIRNEFNAKVQKILAKSEVLMEAKDEGDLVKIYGSIAPGGEKVSDLVVFVPNDGALICIAGTVDMKNIQSILEETKHMR